jgi:hypothetical protein
MFLHDAAILFLLEKLIGWTAAEEFEIVNTYVSGPCALTTRLREQIVNVRNESFM